VRFVLATSNPGKVRELAALFSGSGFELVPLASVTPAAPAEPPAETGDTLLENARLTAAAAARHSGLPAIADDTGLEVDALGGAPGVRSARFAGPRADDEDNRRLLLARLEGVPPERRGARFRTLCVARWPDGREIATEGVLEGRIALVPRGRGGFGYDALFEVPDLGRTLAELDEGEKNALSHRARASAALLRELTRREVAR
jgi:XTP/dITP diphosphohydrolase